MIELQTQCPECGTAVRLGHTERHAICPSCGHLWEPVTAPPVHGQSAPPAVSIEAAAIASAIEGEGPVPSWLRGPEKRPVKSTKRKESAPEPEEQAATIICFVFAWFLPLYLPFMLCAYLLARTPRWKRLATICLLIPLLIIGVLLIVVAIWMLADFFAAYRQMRN
jgi:hypothetical protein